MEDALKRLGISEQGLGYEDSKGLYWETLESAIWGGVLGFCCCGEPERGLRQLRKILMLLEQWMNDGSIEYSDDTILCLYVLDKMKLTQHGSSIYYCWLSEKGKDVLTVLQNMEL